MNGKILVTGSSGFIGSHLKNELESHGYRIVSFNSSDGDISKAKLNFKNIDFVFHLAGKSFVPDSWKDPKGFYEINVVGTLNVLEFCRNNNIGVLLMSSYVYGIPEVLPINENHPINPNNPYAHSKMLAENLGLFYQNHFNLPVCILRPFNVYGPGMNRKLLIGEIISQLYDGKSKEIILQDLSPRRDYLFVDDLIEAMIMLFEKRKTGVYNIGSGTSLSVEEVVNSIIVASPINKRYCSKNSVRKNEISDVVADIAKITADIGWKPKHAFEEGIRKTLLERNHKSAI
jgi:nucleoside-diphosphate-sugar epimerase